jgi:hypothetical protein
MRNLCEIFKVSKIQTRTVSAETICGNTIAQIILHSHFDLVSSVLVQFTSRTIAQMTPEMISSVAFSCTSKEIGKIAFLF